ncbi:Type 1 glutamine amidotransferase-like domain-containing protein [Maribacter sp. 2307ULW6-5]|uniref:Type 1 glutamine amidotransferase-like domain-containing protein n=1 Tax=Maribacter sp. 2307ULW6-5 TaxID=3386275 RepID=UPI0039BC7BEB
MKQQLFIYGSGRHTVPFLKYMAEATGKPRPNLGFLPTASGDDKGYIIRFYETCKHLDVMPHVIGVWVNSYEHPTSFEDRISQMDAIVVGGGNTLNMLAIWEAHGIDSALKKAYENGVVMGGGSAGSLCWFNGGTTDSRPGALSIVKGLAFVNKSHCPHYNSEPSRRPLYHQNIRTGKLTDGYACDDNCAIHFINGMVHTSLALDQESHAYHVFLKEGQVREDRIPNRILV